MMSFEEKISKLQMKELLNNIVKKMNDIRKKIKSGELSGEVYDKNRTKPYTSHFYFNPNYEEFIRTLELNFFISKYSEMSSRDGGKVSIYCLNYGLCQEKNLRWGKPEGSKYRKYFIARPFDFNEIIDNFLKESKQIVCTNLNCQENYSMDKHEHFEFNNMKCPKCGEKVKVIPISDSIEEEIEKIDKSKLLPEINFGILYELNKKSDPLRAKEIAEELDCSYQLIGKRAKKLDEEKGLIKREKKNNTRYYQLTEKAKQTYFMGK